MPPSRYDDVNKVWEDRAFKGYAKATDHPGRCGLLAAGAALLVVVAVVLGGWWIGWWFTGQNVNRESHVLRNSYANQQTLRDQITAQVGNVFQVNAQLAETTDPTEQAALKAQRIAIVNILCGDAAQLAGDPIASDQASFIQTNCAAGVIRPGSPYDAR